MTAKYEEIRDTRGDSGTGDDPRPLQSIAPEGHKDREGATRHSGYQPAEKFARQGSGEYTGPREKE